jgi:hypothetical protein
MLNAEFRARVAAWRALLPADEKTRRRRRWQAGGESV